MSLQICEECGRGAHNHRKIAVMIDGVIRHSITVCRHCAVGIETRLLEILQKVGVSS